MMRKGQTVGRLSGEFTAATESSRCPVEFAHRLQQQVLQGRVIFFIWVQATWATATFRTPFYMRPSRRTDSKAFGRTSDVAGAAVRLTGDHYVMKRKGSLRLLEGRKSQIIEPGR
jgi:hypothetical protein